MFLVNRDGKADNSADKVVEIPGDDASMLEIIKYNTNRLYKDFFGTRQQRKKLIDFTCFSIACFAIKNYGEALSV